MAEPTADWGHPDGRTSGTPERPAHSVAGDLMRFNLAEELTQLQREPGWARDRRNTKTLIKESSLRVVLVALGAGSRLNEHRTDGQISIQVLHGEIALRALGQTANLVAGQLVMLDRGVPHEVEAVKDSAFLITVAWPNA